MTIAQGIRKTVSIGRQTGLGVPKIGAGCQYLRRRTFIGAAPRDVFENDEIVSHHQSTGANYGLKKATQKLDGLLSPGTYQLPIEGMLQKVFAAVTPLVLGVDVTTSATAPQFVDASAGFLAGGVKVGDVVRFTGFTTTATGNNSRNFLVTALTAGNMTGIFLDATAVSVKAPETGSVTVTVVGKKCLAPMTGHTEDYFTIEEFYSDISKSELWNDSRVGVIAVGMPATGNATISIDFVGLGRTLGTAQAQTSPTAETITNALAALHGAIYVNGVLSGNITGSQLTLDCSAADMGAIVGSNSSPDVSRGRIKVHGSFTGLFDSAIYQAFYNAETVVSLVMVIADDTTATSHFVSFVMGQIKIMGDAPDDGEKGILRSYPFTAQLNSAGGAALAFDQTIITIQDSAAA